MNIDSTIDTKVDLQMSGTQIAGAPQPSLTAADNSAFSGSYDQDAIDVITNMRTRISELETALKNLKLIK